MRMLMIAGLIAVAAVAAGPHAALAASTSTSSDAIYARLGEPIAVQPATAAADTISSWSPKAGAVAVIIINAIDSARRAAAGGMQTLIRHVIGQLPGAALSLTNADSFASPNHFDWHSVVRSLVGVFWTVCFYVLVIARVLVAYALLCYAILIAAILYLAWKLFKWARKR